MFQHVESSWREIFSRKPKASRNRCDAVMISRAVIKFVFLYRLICQRQLKPELRQQISITTKIFRLTADHSKARGQQLTVSETRSRTPPRPLLMRSGFYGELPASFERDLVQDPEEVCGDSGGGPTTRPAPISRKCAPPIAQVRGW